MIKKSPPKSSQKILDDEINNYLKLIGENIIRLRGSMTQKDLAKKADLSRTTLSNIENGISIELDNLLKIVKALGVEPADLFLSKEDFRKITYKHKLLIDKLTESLDLETK